MTTATQESALPINGRLVRWRNLHFKKNGESCLGSLLYETAAEAKARLDDVYVIFSEDRACLETEKGPLHFEDYSWSMQYLVME